MSIDWLLTKTLNNNTKKNATKGTPEKSGPSEKTQGSKSKELKQENNCKSQPGDKHSLSSEIQNQQSEIELCCDCGFKGNITWDKTDPKLLEKDKRHFVYFKCPNCKRHLQYDCYTGKIKAKKGVWGILLGRFTQ